LVGRFFEGGAVYDIAVAGSVVLVADAAAGMEIIDVSDPSQPCKIGAVPTGESTPGVAVRGTIAYVADIKQGLSVVDVSDPHSPGLIAEIAVLEGAWGVMVAGDRLHLGCFGGMLVFDISDAYRAVQMATILEAGETLGACGTPEECFTTVSQALSVLDVFDVKDVRKLGHYHIKGGCHGIRCVFGMSIRSEVGCMFIR
jgi:hypothetical protein